MPSPKIYTATEVAARQAAVRPLDGTRASAQAYVDKVTRSQWWKKNCPVSWMNAEWTEDGREELRPPHRIWIEEQDDTIGGITHVSFLTYRNGHRMPLIQLGRSRIYNGIEAIADPWVILHEIAHVMAIGARNDPWTDVRHDKHFIYSFHQLVGRWLGPRHAEALKQACWETEIRINYALI